MSLVAIRGAVTLEKNTSEEIISKTQGLLLEIGKLNNLDPDKVISILFSATKDLNADYPAKAARKLGYTKAGLMCFNEMQVDNSLNKCIRLMILYNGDMEQDCVQHVYLGEAKTLRPDLNR